MSEDEVKISDSAIARDRRAEMWLRSQGGEHHPDFESESNAHADIMPGGDVRDMRYWIYKATVDVAGEIGAAIFGKGSVEFAEGRRFVNSPIFPHNDYNSALDNCREMTRFPTEIPAVLAWAEIRAQSLLLANASRSSRDSSRQTRSLTRTASSGSSARCYWDGRHPCSRAERKMTTMTVERINAELADIGLAHGTDPEGWPAETRAAVDALHEQCRELEGRFDAITRAARWGESGDGSVEGPAVGGSYGYDPDLDAPRFWPSGEPRMTKREAEQLRRWVEGEDLRKQRDTDGGVTYPYGRA